MHIKGYFVVENKYAQDGRFNLVPNNDFLPIDTIPNSTQVYKDETKTIFHTVLHGQHLEKLRILAEVETNEELIDALKISGIWIGAVLSDVHDKFSELAGTVSYTDENNNIFERPIINNISWI